MGQIFDEVWRRYRDFFYVANMHGYDWKALRERYRPLLQDVAHRADLNYVLSEMIAELSVRPRVHRGRRLRDPGAAAGGPPRRPLRVSTAVSGRFRIARIFQGQNEEERYRSPLTEVGVDVQVGDYVLAIDGVELTGDDDPYRLLRDKADPVALTLNEKPVLEGARKRRTARSPSESRASSTWSR